MGAPYRESTNAAAQEPHQDGFLNMQAVFGLVEYYRVRRVDDFVGDFPAAMSWQTVHEQGMGRGFSHEFGVDLIRREEGVADVGFIFLSHAGPHIGVDGVGSGYGFAWVGEEVDGGARRSGEGFGGL